jgi:CubicO group peptidase (beta-lactamase class C family)
MPPTRALVFAIALLFQILFSSAALSLPESGGVPDLATQMRAQTQTTLGGLVREGRSSFAAAIFVADGRLQVASAFGVEGPASPSPFSIESTLFDLNSINKLFIAVAIAQLIHKGTIKSIDDPVNSYLKHFKLPSPQGREVTIRQVATHSAGLDLSGFGAGPLESDPAAFFRARFPGYFDADTPYSAYESYGPKLLAFMVSEISGRPFATYVEESILRPLQMDHTFLTLPAFPLVHRVVSFQPKDPATVMPVPPLRSVQKALLGGVAASTMGDMAKFLAALVGSDEEQHAITQPMRDLMFRVLQSNGNGGSAHGLLFDAEQIGSRTIFVHGGIGPGIDCIIAVDAARRNGLFYCYGDARKRFNDNPAFSPPPYEDITGAMLSPLRACSTDRPEGCVRYPTPRWNDGWNAYLGSYIALARHHHGFSRVRTLFRPTSAKVERAGQTLRLLDHDGFVEIAPGTFGNPKYTETFGFTQDPRTGKMMLSISDRPSAYERPGILENPALLSRLFAFLILIALSGGLFLLFPKFGIDARTRAAVTVYSVIVGVGVCVMYGCGAFGSRYFEGIAWPANIVRICAFATIPACAWLIAVTYRANGAACSGIARCGRIYLNLICISSILMVLGLTFVELISFGRIT